MKKIMDDGKVVDLENLTKKELLEVITELQKSLTDIFQARFDAETRYDANKDGMTDKNKIVFLENHLRGF
jgi:hypothetical protein